MKEIIELAKHTEAKLRCEAIQHFETLGTPLAAEWLAWLLSDNEENVRLAAAWAIARLDEVALPALLKFLNRRYRRRDIGVAMGAIGSPALNLLLVAVRNPNGRIRWAAAHGLVQVGQPAFEPLLTILADSKHFGQDAAAIALGDIRDNRAVEPLILQLERTERMTQYRVIEALEKLGDSRAIEPLIRVMRAKTGANISKAEFALVVIGTPESIAAVNQWRNELFAYYRDRRAEKERSKRDLPTIHPKQP